MLKRLKRLARRGMTGYLYVFAVAGVMAIAFGILFGLFDTIANKLNQTAGITIDQSFYDIVNTGESFASIGLLIMVSIGLIGLAMLLINVIKSRSE